MARRRAVEGSPLRISARDYNDACDAGQWFAQQQSLGRGGSGTSAPINPCTVIIRNDSGSDLPQGAVVQLDDSPLSVLDRRHLWFTADEPSTTTGFYGVLLEPVLDGKYGPAQVSGTCLALADIDSTSHTHLQVVASQTKFQSGTDGWARLVNAATTGDDQLVPVLLGGFASKITAWKSLHLTCDIAYGGGSQIKTTAPAGWKVYKHWGQADGYEVTANTSRTNYDDWSFSIDTAGRYMFVIDWTHYGPASTGEYTKTYTTSTPSAGTSHTHTVTVDAERFGWLRTQFKRQAGGSGSWSYLPSTDGGGFLELHDTNRTASSSTTINTICTVFDEPAITAGDRFRLETLAFVDTRETTPTDWAWARSSGLIRLMICRLGDAETPASP